LLPDRIVFTYQGDGDLASIGMGEIIHAASRGEDLTVIFVNNAVFGMTKGQMAPTSLIGQKTTTTVGGRSHEVHGHPIRVCELLASLEGAVYLERVALDSPAGVLKTKNAVRKAFQCQIEEKGFSLVEVLVTCPTNWKMSPIESMRWVREEMTKTFPPGLIKDTTAGKTA